MSSGVGFTFRDAVLADTILLLLLYLKLHFGFLRTGAAKAAAGKRAPEDDYQKKPVSPEEQAAADAIVDRWQRVSSNDVENILVGISVIWSNLLVLLFSIGVIQSNGPFVLHTVCSTLFTVARYAHTVTYAFKLSYPRTAAYLLGHVSLMVLLIHSIVIAGTADSTVSAI
jgi:uncharacterized MAPEG superfamily protein